MLTYSLLKLRVSLIIAVLIASISIGRFSYSPGFRPRKQFVLTPPTPVTSTTRLTGEARDIYVNVVRRISGLESLVWRENLSALAVDYSRQMAEEGFFSHYDPIGRNLADRTNEAGVCDWLKIGGNLFTTQSRAGLAMSALTAWKESPLHIENIEDGSWTHTGIGVYNAGRAGIFVTQIFWQKTT